MPVNNDVNNFGLPQAQKAGGNPSTKDTGPAILTVVPPKSYDSAVEALKDIFVKNPSLRFKAGEYTICWDKDSKSFVVQRNIAGKTYKVPELSSETGVRQVMIFELGHDVRNIYGLQPVYEVLRSITKEEMKKSLILDLAEIVKNKDFRKNSFEYKYEEQDPDLKTYEEASSMFAKGDLRGALKAFEGISPLRRDSRVLYNIAYCYEKLGEYKKADEAYRQGMRTAKPEDMEDFQTGLARCEKKLKSGEQKTAVAAAGVLNPDWEAKKQAVPTNRRVTRDTIIEPNWDENRPNKTEANQLPAPLATPAKSTAAPAPLPPEKEGLKKEAPRVAAAPEFDEGPAPMPEPAAPPKKSPAAVAQNKPAPKPAPAPAAPAAPVEVKTPAKLTERQQALIEQARKFAKMKDGGFWSRQIALNKYMEAFKGVPENEIPANILREMRQVGYGKNQIQVATGTARPAGPDRQDPLAARRLAIRERRTALVAQAMERARTLATKFKDLGQDVTAAALLDHADELSLAINDNANNAKFNKVYGDLRSSIKQNEVKLAKLVKEDAARKLAEQRAQAGKKTAAQPETTPTPQEPPRGLADAFRQRPERKVEIKGRSNRDTRQLMSLNDAHTKFVRPEIARILDKIVPPGGTVKIQISYDPNMDTGFLQNIEIKIVESNLSAEKQKELEAALQKLKFNDINVYLSQRVGTTRITSSAIKTLTYSRPK